ncbi:hypothetical protein [Devosia sp.]|uniref:hypothetical protein n=1 Tax=Devosia sp. TaxID=1871048 RepID=UPI003F719866
MVCFDDPTRALLVERNISVDSVNRMNEYYDLLAQYEIANLEVDDPENIAPEKVVLNNLEWLRQGILHRALSLTKATSVLAPVGHVHAIALCTRGQLECTAQLGYLGRRTAAYLRGAVSAKDMARLLGEMLTAASHHTFEGSPKPTNVMTYFDKADLHLGPLMKGKQPIPNMLRDQYDWLSDFCHPNFQSAALSTTLDAEARTVTFHHGAPLSDRDAELFTNLGISLGAFLMLWDDLEKQVRQLRAAG